MNQVLAKILKNVLAEVGMQKLQKHLDTQAKKAVKQATKRMLANKTSRKIIAEEVFKQMSDEELLAEMRRRGLRRYD